MTAARHMNSILVHKSRAPGVCVAIDGGAPGVFLLDRNSTIRVLTCQIKCSMLESTTSMKVKGKTQLPQEPVVVVSGVIVVVVVDTDVGGPGPYPW